MRRIGNYIVSADFVREIHTNNTMRLSKGNQVVILEHLSDDISIMLPPVTSCVGTFITVLLLTSGGNAVVVDADDAAVTISEDIDAVDECKTFMSDGLKWLVIG